MWRIGALARMVGVSERTLRHYDKVGLLAPAATDHVTGYRWYGVTELARLERIRGLQRLGLSLRQIADILDAPEAHVRQALVDTVAALRRDVAVKEAAIAAAEDRLARPSSVMPQEATVGPRRLRVRQLQVADPSRWAALCPPSPAVLLTWLRGQPVGGFRAAVPAGPRGERLDLPVRTVIRAVVPPETAVVRAGIDLFDWLARHRLTVAGPTLEEHLVDADGVSATVLEIPVRARLRGVGSAAPSQAARRRGEAPRQPRVLDHLGQLGPAELAEPAGPHQHRRVAVEVGGGEERRRLVLHQRLLVRVGLDPEDDHVGVPLPVSGSTASGRGLRKNTNDFPPTW